MGTNLPGGAARRPFSSWRTPYREGNSSLGYFTDLVLEARCQSPTVFLKEIGMDHRTIDPRAVLDSLLLLPLDAATKVALDHASARVKGRHVELCGQLLRRRHWSIRWRRWCPACLAESPHHRTWWDVLPYVVCHLHGCPIEDADADGLPLEWWWPYMAESPRGHRLARPGTRLARQPNNLSAYIAGRLGYFAATPVPLLDGAPLGDAVNFVRILARCLDWRKVRVPSQSEFASAATANAFGLCVRGKDALVEEFRRLLVERVPVEERVRGMRCYGWMQYAGRELDDAGLGRVFGDILKEALERVGIVGVGQRGPRYAAAASQFTGLFDLSVKFGLDRRGLLALADRIEVMPDRTWSRGRLAFDAASVAAISSALQGLMTREEVEGRLGLAPSVLRRMSAAGTLVPLLNVSRGNAPGGRFLLGDVERVEQAIGAGLPVAGLEPVEPADSCDRDEASVGNPRPQAVDPGGMCRAEVQAQLNVTVETVRALEDRRLLDRVADADGTGARDLFDREGVRILGKRLASARTYVGVLGATPSQVVAALAGYGIDPVVGSAPDGRVTPMFDRAAVRRSLALERDPDAPGARRIDDLWNALRRELARECPRLKCPDRVPADIFKIYTGSRKAAFAVTVDRSDGSLRVGVSISRRRSGRRWRLFEADRNAILDATPAIEWNEGPDELEGVIRIGGEDDVAEAVVAMSRLTCRLGAGEVGPKLRAAVASAG